MPPIEIKVFGPKGEQYEASFMVVCHPEISRAATLYRSDQITPDTLEEGLRIAKEHSERKRYGGQEKCEVTLEILTLKGQRKPRRRG